MKRIISIALVLIMILSLAVPAAWAEKASGIVETEMAESKVIGKVTTAKAEEKSTNPIGTMDLVSKRPFEKEEDIVAEIFLDASKKEFLAENKSVTVYFYAEVYGDISKVELLDRRNNVIAVMKNDGLFKLSGDDIVNDGVFSAKLDINLSVADTFAYHVAATINGKKASSNTVTIKIIAPLTSQDLSDFKVVDHVLGAMRTGEEYLKLNPEERAEVVCKTLMGLSEKGHIAEGSIQYNEKEQTVVYKYNSGVLAAEHLVEFSKDQNGAAMSDDDLQDMDTVNKALGSLRESKEYNQMTPEQRAKEVLHVLAELADKKLISAESVSYDESAKVITFKYSSGILAGEMLKDPEPETNQPAISKAEKEAAAEIDRKKELGEIGDAIIDWGTNDLKDAEADKRALILWSFNMGWDDPAFRVPFYEDLERDWNAQGLRTTRVMGTTVSSFKQMAEYDVIAIAGHGSHINGRPYFLASEQANTASLEANQIDLLTGRVVLTGSPSDSGGQRFGIFPALISEYYNSNALAGSFVFSEACTIMGSYYHNNSVVNEVFANAFLSRGTEAMVAFYNSVYASYSRDFMKTYLQKLIDGNTAEESFNEAINVHGAHDSHSHPDTSVPHLRGDRTAILFPAGIRNGSFELDHASAGFDHLNPLRYWTVVGDARNLALLGSLSPREGSRMAMLSTGIGSARNTVGSFYDGTQGSAIKQTFRVPNDANYLFIEYNMISEEPSFLPQFVDFRGSRYNDAFIAEIIDSQGVVTRIVNESVNDSGWRSTPVDNLKLTIGNIGNPGRPPYQIGWYLLGKDIESFRGQIITLRFVVFDRGDQIYDSVSILDNISIC